MGKVKIVGIILALFGITILGYVVVPFITSVNYLLSIQDAILYYLYLGTMLMILVGIIVSLTKQQQKLGGVLITLFGIFILILNLTYLFVLGYKNLVYADYLYLVTFFGDHLGLVPYNLTQGLQIIEILPIIFGGILVLIDSSIS